MQMLNDLDRLGIQQQKEWGEIFTGFETSNRYAVMDERGHEICYAAEISEGLGTWLLKNWLKAARPFTIKLLDAEGRSVLEVKRPFRFFFHEANIHGPDGEFMGNIKRQFSLLRRIYTIYDADGVEQAQLFGPILRPWTFLIRRDGVESGGAIRKQWSGFLKEGFSDADNFGIEFPPNATPTLKAVLLGSVFLIDFCHFENTSNNN